MDKKTKAELLEEVRNLADKHAELKSTITEMLDEAEKKKLEYDKIIELKSIVTEILSEIDKIELEYSRVVEEIKKN